MDKKRFYVFILLLVVVTSFSIVSYGLEIDEKLTCRILRLSSTKKTMLINRGLEDGVVVGDHAKFFITTGVVARGVIVKAAPTRSIWALYRLVSPSELNVDSVINLKIAAPVKLSHDSSKTFGRDRFDDDPSFPVLTQRGEIGLGGKTGDIPVDLTRGDRDELDGMFDQSGKVPRRDSSRRTSVTPSSEVDVSRNWELWGVFQFKLFSTSSTSLGTTTTGSEKSFDTYIGLERYFSTQQQWYTPLSPFFFIHFDSQSRSEDEGNVSRDQSVTEFGLGANWHFLANPLANHRIIGFVNGTLAYGSGSLNTVTTVGINQTIDEYSGNASSFSLGLGAKYHFPWGLSLRMFIDYYARTEVYDLPTSDQDDETPANLELGSHGLRYFAGLSYRF